MVDFGVLLSYAIGIFIGLIIAWIYNRWSRKHPTKVDALLGVDTRDPDTDYYDFVLLIPTIDVPKRKYLTVEVKVKDGAIKEYD